MDSKSRSITEAITWTILALLITIIACFALLSSWSMSIAIGILSSPVETLLYYIHKMKGKKTPRTLKQT